MRYTSSSATKRYVLHYSVFASLLVLMASGLYFLHLEPNALSMDIITKGKDVYTLQYESEQDSHAETAIQARIDSPPQNGTVSWFGIPFPELQGFNISFESSEKRTIVKSLQVHHEFHRFGVRVPLYRWTSHKLLEAFAPTHDVNATTLDLEDRVVHITSTGNRATFIYQGSIDVLRREISQHIYLWKIFFLFIMVIILGGIFMWTSRNDARVPKPSLAFIGILLLLFAALAMNGYLFIKNPNFGGDAGRYIFPAYNFMHGKGHTLDGIVQFYPPGYGFITYFISLFIPDLQKAGMLVSSGAYILSIIVAYYIGRFLAGEMAAFLSALFLTTCPYILRYSYVTLTESLYIFLVLLSFFVYLKILHEPPTYLRSGILGILFGLTYCVRDEGFLLFIGSIGVWGILLLWQQRSERRLRKKIRLFSYPLCMLLFGALLIAIPVGHLYYHTGHWSISGKLYIAFNRPSLKQTENIIDRKPEEHVDETARSDNQNKAYSGFVSYVFRDFERLNNSMRQVWSHLWKITLHALVPLICIFSWFLGYRLWKRARYIVVGHERKNHHIRFIKNGMACLVFISPLLVLTLWGDMKLRHVLLQSAFLVPILAVIITTLLNSLPSKQKFLGFTGVCVLSIVTASGAIEHIPFVKERVFFPEYMVTKDSMQILKKAVQEDRMPDDYISALKAVKWQKFTDKNFLFQEIEAELEREIAPQHRQTILKAALISPFTYYTFLPDLFKEQHTSITLKRAAQWLQKNAKKPLKDLKIMARKGNIILFYAEGRTHPPGGIMVSIPTRSKAERHLPLSYFVETMRLEQVDYLVVNVLAFPRQKNLKQLWDNPGLADDIGLVLEYDNRNDELGVQIYSLAENTT